MDIIVIAHDPTWKIAFAEESARIRDALPDCELEVYHIGSTAIPSICAKPIIDMLLVVQDLVLLDTRVASMLALGYEAKGEFGIEGRRYFRKNAPSGVRTHHVHAFERGSAGERRHLAFRDYMISHPGFAQEYGALKQRLAANFPNSMEDYMNGKSAFIKYHETLALAWLTRSRQEERPSPHTSPR